MQPKENDKNPNFGPNLHSPKLFSWVLPLLVVRQCPKLSSYATSKKSNEPNYKKCWKKPLILDPILVHLAQIWAPRFFLWVLPLLVVRVCSKLSSYGIYRKLMNQTWENGKKSNSEHVLAFLAPSFFAGFISTSS